VDTDGDGFFDFAEVLLNSDYSNPHSKPPLGDVNGDGTTNLLDATCLARLVRDGASDYNPLFDLNLDGAVDHADAIVLYNWAIGTPGFEGIPITNGASAE